MKTARLLPIVSLTLSTAALAQSTPPPAAAEGWKTQRLTEHFWSEGACAGDVNKDGKADVLSGPYWYEGPDFSKRHQIYPAKKSFKAKQADGSEQEIPGFEGALSGKNAYSDNFISYTQDFNGDGWLDYLVIGFPGQKTSWYENPQGKDQPWTEHIALEVTDNESPMFADITGDGKPELLCMSGGYIGYAEPNPQQPNDKWRWHRISAQGPYQKFTHGIGFGDVNGDGKNDVLESRGWWEQPASLDGDPTWKFHEALFGKGGSQMYATDVNGDGKNDVITALEAHGYGIAWFEQTTEGGAQGWTQHLITGTPKTPGGSGITFSQPHAIDHVDMNGDGVKDFVTGKRFWAHGPGGDAEPNAAAVLYWFELKREGGKATWTPHFIHGDSGVGTQVMATDLNGDGKLDVVVGNKKGTFVHVRQ